MDQTQLQHLTVGGAVVAFRKYTEQCLAEGQSLAEDSAFGNWRAANDLSASSISAQKLRTLLITLLESSPSCPIKNQKWSRVENLYSNTKLLEVVLDENLNLWTSEKAMQRGLTSFILSLVEEIVSVDGVFGPAVMCVLLRGLSLSVLQEKSCLSAAPHAQCIAANTDSNEPASVFAEIRKTLIRVDNLVPATPLNILLPTITRILQRSQQETKSRLVLVTLPLKDSTAHAKNRRKDFHMQVVQLLLSLTEVMPRWLRIVMLGICRHAVELDKRAVMKKDTHKKDQIILKATQHLREDSAEQSSQHAVTSPGKKRKRVIFNGEMSGTGHPQPCTEKHIARTTLDRLVFTFYEWIQGLHVRHTAQFYNEAMNTFIYACLVPGSGSSSSLLQNHGGDRNELNFPGIRQTQTSSDSLHMDSYKDYTDVEASGEKHKLQGENYVNRGSLLFIWLLFLQHCSRPAVSKHVERLASSILSSFHSSCNNFEHSPSNTVSEMPLPLLLHFMGLLSHSTTVTPTGVNIVLAQLLQRYISVVDKLNSMTSPETSSETQSSRLAGPSRQLRGGSILMFVCLYVILHRGDELALSGDSAISLQVQLQRLHDVIQELKPVTATSRSFGTLVWQSASLKFFFGPMVARSFTLDAEGLEELQQFAARPVPFSEFKNLDMSLGLLSHRRIGSKRITQMRNIGKENVALVELLGLNGNDSSTSDATRESKMSMSIKAATTDEKDEQVLFRDFPSEVLTSIFSYLSAKRICMNARVCKRWADVGRSPILWKELFLRRWPLKCEHLSVDLSFGSEQDSRVVSAQHCWRRAYQQRWAAERERYLKAGVSQRYVVCDYCGCNQVLSAKTLERHRFKHKQDKRIFICPVDLCDFRTKGEERLRHHLRKKH